MSKIHEEIIQIYIEGYNEFDVEKMTCDFDDNIIFKNIQNGKVNMTLNGISEFKQQAEQAKTFFVNRRQQIISFRHDNNTTEIEINYSATLATDFPNELKKGDKLELKGKSIFVFKENKILQLTDIS